MPRRAATARTAARAPRVRGSSAGRSLTRAKFPEGTKLILQVDRPVPPIELTAEDERAIDQALASVRAGKGVALDTFRELLQHA